MGDYRFVLFLEVCYVFSYCVCSQRREFKGQIGYKEGKGEIELVINVIDEEKKEDAEAVVLLSSCPRASEAGAEEALAMLSSYDRPVNLPHTSLSISSCERELQLQVFSEHSYSLSTLCSIDPSCIFDLSYSIDPSCILEISGSVEPSCSIETSGSIGSSCSIEPSVSVGSGCSIDLSLEEIYSYVTPEKMYSNFFNLGLLFRALFEFYRDKLLLHIYESVPVVVPQARSHTERVIKDAFSVILDSYIDNILSMRAVYRFLKCPGIHLSGYTEDRFLSESSIALLREELDLLMPHCVEGVTKTVLALSNSESIRKNKKTLLTDDLVSVISSSISGAFYKCVPIFLELITSREFLKKVFFKNIPGFDGKIFSPVSQNILSLNRRFFCKVSLLENRYLVSMVLGMVLGIGKEIPGIEELLDSYVKDLRDIVLDSVSKGLFFALGSSGDIVPLKAFIPVIEGVSDYLRRETSLRITSRKKVFRERLQIRGFWELDVSSGEDDGFYKSLDGVILNSKNYVGNGFSYYLMRVFAPICVSVARDVNKIFGSIIGSELSLLTCFRLEARVRYGMFDFIFSALSGMDTLSEVDKKLEKISPHVGMNVCELYDDIFSENIIE
ncbi:hypothetical protein, partial [Candidatus Ichthyocystis sparus]|uniref:hypothetical protein n=1 Tax=Candidatus Ichthyocystis sparus TaxID=1561004 RepID=UPI00114645B5